MKHAEAVYKSAEKVLGRGVVSAFVKPSFFRHFCAGEDEFDIAPTIAHLCGTELVGRGPLDGRDVSDRLLGRNAGPVASPPFLYYAAKGQLAAIRRGPWKLHLESGELYHLEQDVEERRAVQGKNEELAAELRELALRTDAALVARARSQGSGGDLAFDPRLEAKAD